MGKKLTPEERKVKLFDWYKHFNSRLLERHGFEISYQEWINLPLTFEIVKNRKNGTSTVITEIKGVIITAIMENTKDRILRTALPNKK